MLDDTTRAVRNAMPEGLNVKPGDRIGDWVVESRIGAGGSSVVVRARRTREDFQQIAALKVLTSGTSGFVDRFQRERTILLQLVHPHIVRLLDGGTTPAGRPWYAMELIEGRSLTQWANDAPSTVQLRVLADVCRAVHFAHQRLVVHCDLKPDNVWIDADGTPHVLDFGIAKLIDEPDHTGLWRPLTPRWAAPEQLGARPVTVATDVYALGLLLWAVLTGKTPRADLTGPALAAAAERPVPLPSSVDRRLRGDLDAIVMRATAVDPAERYRTAEDLADDLTRHLRGEAVAAREGATLYRIVRWARHRPAVALGLAGAALLVTGWGVTATIQSRRIAVERDRAQLQATRAEASLDLLVNVLKAADPAEAQGEDLTIAEVLSASVRELDLEVYDPAIAGEVRLAVAGVQYAIGNRTEAITSLERTIEQLRVRYPPTHRMVLKAELELAYARAGQNWWDATPHRQDAVAVLARLRAHAPPSDIADGLMRVADIFANTGELERGRVYAQEARETYLALGDTRRAARALGVVGAVDCRLDLDTTALEEAWRETERVLGTQVHPEVADMLHELALCSPEETSLARAEQAITIRRALYGESWLLASTLNNFGLTLETSDPDRARTMLAEAVRLAEASLGPDDARTHQLRVNQGAVLVDIGHEVDGLEILQSVAATSALPPELRARAWRHIGRVAAREGRTVDARQAFEPCIALLAPRHGERTRCEAALAELP